MTRAIALAAAALVALALLVERWTRPPVVDDIDWLAEYRHSEPDGWDTPPNCDEVCNLRGLSHRHGRPIGWSLKGATA